MRIINFFLAVLAAWLPPNLLWAEAAEPFDITFAARGEATSVESVTVTNLTDPSIAPVTLSGTDILRLVDPSSIPTAIESIQVGEGVTRPILTPNPSMGDGTLIFDAKESGPVRISIFTTDGKQLETATLQVTKGRNTAFIPSQSPGIYIVSIEGKGLKSSARWICGGSRSGSHIALGGAAQWANASLPFAAPWQGVQTRSQSQANAEATNVVRMNFHEGDILRFDGTSGEMRTIMHLSPESSHDVFFDFFLCKDADGYNYPIVRAGDLLWMLEDLHPLDIKMTGLLKTSDPTIWKGLGEYAAACFVSGDRGYYTMEGARMAIPEGWEMPSIDEIYAFIKELNADSLKLADFMKDRDYNWPLPLEEGPDTIHMQLVPHGFINPNGELVEGTLTGAWVTRNTINHGCPVSFEVKATDSRLYPLVIHEKRCGFTVRGCRPAPSVYNEMLVQVFNSQSEETNAAPRRMPMQLVNTNGPLGAYYTYGSDRSSVFFDYSGRQYSVNDDEQRSGVLYKQKSSGNWVFESKNLVPIGVNGTINYLHLRKVTAQGNASGYENVVYASWSKPFRAFTDGTNKNSVASVASVMGDGVVYVTIYGDSTKNHATLDGYATRPLLDANGNTYQWTMPTFDNSKLSRKMYRDNQIMSDYRYQYFARAFNLKCIQDQTGDGVEEIVMNVANKIAVFDGVTLRCICERVYADEGSYIGVPNLRFDVADVNGDGYEDIVLLLNSTSGIAALKVYSQGHVSEAPLFESNYGSDALFCDVKVGNLSGHGTPEIAFLTRGMENGKNDLLTKNGFLYVYRLEYDSNMDLQQTVVLGQTSVDCFADNNERRYHLGNMDLVFGYFRGRSYNQDLVVGNGLWRYDDAQMKPTFRFQILPRTRSENFSMPADAIMAVQLLENGNESLMFIWNILCGTGNGGVQTFSEFGEIWLNADGNSSIVKTSFNVDYFGWGKVGKIWKDGWQNPELTQWMRYSEGGEVCSHPVICKFADRECAKHFRFISHEISFSEPRIYAAIAAAPYYEGLDGSDGAGSTWGKVKSDGTSTAKSDTWGGSIIAGYEHSFSAPFLSAMDAGVEFTMKVSAAAGIATEHETTYSYGQTYAAGKDHVVVMHATPFDTYTYEIIGSDDPDDLGTEFVLSMPRTRRFVGLKLEDYVRLMGSQKHVAKPQKYLTATPGVPSSYPPLYDTKSSLYYVNDKHPFLQGHDLNGGNSYEMTGTGASTSRSISLATSDSHTTTVEVGVETELVGTLMGIKAGVGFNYNHTNESTHTIGEELTVEGTVPGLPSLNDPDHPQFNWNIVWFYVKDEGGVYPVVNYAVTEK